MVDCRDSFPGNVTVDGRIVPDSRADENPQMVELLYLSGFNENPLRRIKLITLNTRRFVTGLIEMEKRLIWDIPTRLFHWLLVACIVAQYLTAEVLDAIDWHFKIGYFTLGLILFRLLWGFAGTTYARFSQFLAGPGKVLSYAKTMTNPNSPEHAGHNPMGGWMVIALLLLVALQGISGLFIGDDIINNGPYYDAVSDATRDTMNSIHHTAFNILLAAIALHISAVVFYARFKKQMLVPAMLHGKKPTNEAGISSSRLLLALILVIIVIAAMYYAIEIAPPAPAVDADMYY